jgi:hypothetical protein
MLLFTLLTTSSGVLLPPKLAGQSKRVSSKPAGPVRVVGHSLVDDRGPFLGLGVSYFTALWRCRHDRKRLESDLAFLSRQGFNYYRMLSMVGWYPAWEGREIAPVAFISRAGKRIDAWHDYWQQFRELIDLAYDCYGMRAQITLFADAQLMPDKAARMAHMDRLLREVLPGREHKIILIEVANEAWQNGFPGAQGNADLREFTRFLAERTAIPVATTSNHEQAFADLYADSAADIATWHFSRDRKADDGWKPVYDCWDLGDLPGFPPVSSNEPIGPGASVHSETDSTRLVMAAAFAYAAKLPMYVFHCEAGVFGRSRFEETPGVDRYRHLRNILPGDLPNWTRNDGKERAASFTVFAAGYPDRYAPEVADSQDGCIRNTGSRKGDRFVCVPIGIRPEGLELQARQKMRFRVFNPVTGKAVRSVALKPGERVRLPQGPGAYLLVGSIVR